MKPKLTIDVGPLLDEQWTGIPIFTRRLVRALQTDARLSLDFGFDLMKLPPARVEAALALSAGAGLREYVGATAHGAPDFVDFDAPILYPSNKLHCAHLAREASTVHDLSTLVMPENHSHANVAQHLDRFAEEIATDEAVFCISNATRAALHAAMPSAAPKSRLLYQYVDWPDTFPVIERNMPEVRLGRYAVVIGTIEPRKNLGLLLEAMSLPKVANLNLTFVVAGKKGWLVDSFLESLSDDQKKRLIFTGFVSEFVKYRLIANALFLVFPSLYEGFGIPALEAMSLGKPVLAARTSSFPEVIGPAGIYFDPLSVAEFADALEEIANPRRIAELSPAARARNAEFTPARMAAPIVDWVEGQ